MFLQKGIGGYYYLAEKVNGKAQYRESIGRDPNSWLHDEILKAINAGNEKRVDDLRKIQKRRTPTLLPTSDNCYLSNKALENITSADFPLGLPDAIITDPPYGKEYLGVKKYTLY